MTASRCAEAMVSRNPGSCVRAPVESALRARPRGNMIRVNMGGSGRRSCEAAAQFLTWPSSGLVSGLLRELSGLPEAPHLRLMGDLRLERLRKALSDRYDVEYELKGGGQALVYRARDLKTPRTVAIKVIHLELADAAGV